MSAASSSQDSEVDQNDEAPRSLPQSEDEISESEVLTSESESDDGRDVALDARTQQATVPPIGEPVPVEPESQFELETNENAPPGGFDVIMIHGIRDDRATVWKKAPKYDDDWIQRYLLQSLPWCQLSYFYYNTASESGSIFLQDGIDQAAFGLLDCLKAMIEHRDESKKDRELIFVSRDLGGVIVKRALTIARRESSKYACVETLVKTLIFFNCPHMVSSEEEASDMLISLLALPGPPVFPGFVGKVQRLSDQLRRINDGFVLTKWPLQTHLFNVLSIEPMNEAPPGSTDLGYFLSPAQAFLVTPFERHLTSRVSHGSLAVAEQKAEPNGFLDVCKAINKFLRQTSHLTGDRISREAMEAKKLLMSMSPLMFPLKPFADPTDGSLWAWTQDQEQYKAWKSVSAHGTQVLHLKGSAFAKPASNGLYLDFIESGVQDDSIFTGFYYEFRKRGTRSPSSSTHSMIVSFIAQLVQHLPSFSLESVYRFLRQVEVFSLIDLMQTFEVLLYQFLPDTSHYYWFIFSIDECCDEDIVWVIRRLREWNRHVESPFKLVVTSGTSGYARDFLDDCWSIQSNESPEAEEKMNKDLKSNQIQNLRLEISRDFPFLDEFALSRIVERTANDIELTMQILTWIPSLHEIERVKTAVDRLDKEPELTPSSVSWLMERSIPLDLQTLANTAIPLVQYAMRPITFAEATSALTVALLEDGVDIDGDASHSTFTKLQNLFTGTFGLWGGQVEFVPHWPHRDEPNRLEMHHASLAKLCLRFLQLPSTKKHLQASVDSLKDLRDAVFPSDESWAFYAVMHLIDHYRLAGAESPEEDMIRFFSDDRARAVWSEAFYAFSNPRSRIDRSYVGPLPVLAKAGLRELVDRQIRMQKSSPEFDTRSFELDCSFALAEACQRGHASIVRLLLTEITPGEKHLEDAMLAAGRSGNHEVACILVDLATKMKDFRWPDALLHRMAWLGDVVVVQKLVNADIDVNHRGTHQDESPLLACIRGGHEDVAAILINAGADVNFSNSDGWTPMHCAAICNRPSIVKLLLGAGADLEDGARETERPLQVASRRSMHLAVETLLEAGAMTEWQTEHPRSEKPLTSAAERGHVNCVRSLLSHGADNTVFGQCGTALQAAVNNGHLEVVRELLEKGSDPNYGDETVMLPLLQALDRENIAMLELLLDHGANVEIEDESIGQDQRGNTALTLAAAKKNTTLFDIIMSKEPDVNHIGTGFPSPLFAAVYNGCFDHTQRLLKAGAEVNVTMSKPATWSPIHASYDNIPILKLLIDNGADLNALSDDGTVLYLAVLYDFPDSVTALVEYGEKLDIDRAITSTDDNQDDLTPLCIACKNDRVEIMRTLLEAGADVDKRTRNGAFPLMFCMEQAEDSASIYETVRTLLEYHPRITERDDLGDTVLHKVLGSTPVSVVRALVNAGADIEARNKAGVTPLFQAVDCDNYDVVKYLIAKGVNFQVSRSTTASALRMACANGSLDMVKLLAEAPGGVDVNEIDNVSGETILHFVASYASSLAQDILEYLVKERNANIQLKGGMYMYPFIMRARASSSADELDFFVERGVDVNVEDQSGIRAVHLCVRQHGWLEGLIKYGADVKAVDKLGRTCLHYAAAIGSTQFVERLLKTQEIEVDARDDLGWTPLMWAATGSSDDLFGFASTTGALLKAGASVWARSSMPDGEWSPLKLARYYNSTRHVHGLLDRLEPSEKTRLNDQGEKEIWDAEFHQTAVGWDLELTKCSSCFTTCYGTRYHCLASHGFEAPEYVLCFRCYHYKDTLHPQHDDFKQIGNRYRPELSPVNSDRSSSSATSTRATDNEDAA